MLSKRFEKYITIIVIVTIVGIYLYNSIYGSPTLNMIHTLIFFVIAIIDIICMVKIGTLIRKLKNMENEFYNMKNLINNMTNNGINNDFQNINNIQHNNNNPFIN